MASLFTAATKRAPLNDEGNDAAEDRLTEIFAAVLARAPEAARTLVESWTGTYFEGDPDVRTQRPITGGRVDLELRFTDRTSDRITAIWVEVKRDAGPSGDQLRRYARDLKRQLATGEVHAARLVHLTRPRDWSDLYERYFDGDHDDLRRPDEATWPKTSSVLARWSRTGDGDLFQKGLVREFVDYLKEDHVATEGLTLDGAIVLQRFKETDEAFADLLAETAKKLAESKSFTELDRKREVHRLTGGAWRECWWTYKPATRDDWHEAVLLEWNFEFRDPPRHNRYCFASGLTWTGPGERVPWRDFPDWPSEDADSAEFSRYFDGAYHRLYRWLQPEELAARGSLDEQVAHLGDWVAATFDFLIESWPPR